MREVTPDTLAAIVEKHRDKVTVYRSKFYKTHFTVEGQQDLCCVSVSTRVVEAELLRWIAARCDYLDVEDRSKDGFKLTVAVWLADDHTREVIIGPCPTLVEALAAACEAVEA